MCVLYIYIYFFLYFCLIYTQLDKIVIKYTDEASEKTKEECCPGAPYMSFSKAKPLVPIYISNPQSCNGLFELCITISQDDTVADVVSRIVKQYNHIKGI